MKISGSNTRATPEQQMQRFYRERNNLNGNGLTQMKYAATIKQSSRGRQAQNLHQIHNQNGKSFSQTLQDTLAFVQWKHDVEAAEAAKMQGVSEKADYAGMTDIEIMTSIY